MPFKTDANGAIVIDAEKKLPIFVHTNGTEAPFDADATLGTITRLNGEAKGHREAKEAAEARLKGFEGIEDGEAARKALETVKSLSAGDLKTAAQVQEIKDAAARAAQEQVAAAAKASATQIQELTATLDKRTAELNNHMVGGGFSGSKLLSDDKHPMRLAIPAEMARAYFGGNFKVEDGKIVPYDAAGNKIYSPTRPGEVADFDEGLAQLVQACPFKDQILKGSGASGSGAHQSGKSGSGGKREITRAQFDGMDAGARQAAIKEGAVFVD
ncbi:DUF6651 domain-containing protein [Duganella callida]|uniref:DUF6651 domain-containing protein n=1 Tax=Duganella callida TaxID=2561932 RepID=A0A4Y9S643_9BURK|nr:DUF6651 domain-containing protein [Duganella callida]TFW15959.1 hypothetical protein E4L98_25025 [Duganella callida]